MENIYHSVINGNFNETAKLVQKKIENGASISNILNNGLISAMDEVGRRFSAGLIYVPEMLIAAKAMQAGLEIIKPNLIDKDIKSKGTILIGTVKGDLHDIGKNLVGIFMQGAGFNVIDLGINVDAEKFIGLSEAEQIDIVGLSALLTTTLPAMSSTVNMLKKNLNNIPVIVGGAPVTKDFADKIGADGFGKDAVAAVKLSRELLASNH